jgi:hypothetical protein
LILGTESAIEMHMIQLEIRGFRETVPIIHFCSHIQAQAHHSNALYIFLWETARGKNARVSYDNRISNANIKIFLGIRAFRNKRSM